MARPPMKTDNKLVKEFLIPYTSYYTLPAWADDLIRGSKGQMTALQSQVGSASVFRLLQSLEEITTANVRESINKKRVALGDPEYSPRMVEYYTAAARCASQAIMHRLLTDTMGEDAAYQRQQAIEQYLDQYSDKEGVEGDVAREVRSLRREIADLRDAMYDNQ